MPSAAASKAGASLPAPRRFPPPCISSHRPTGARRARGQCRGAVCLPPIRGARLVFFSASHGSFLIDRLATRRRSMRNDPFHPASTLQCTQSPYGAERLPPTDGHPTTIIVLMSSFVNMAKPIFNIRLTDYGVRVSVLSALHPPTKPLPDAVPSTLLGFRAGSFPCCLRLPRAWATISIATLR